MPAVGTDRRMVLQRRVRLLVAATIAYNVVEAVVALAAGTIAGSVALIGFGLDSWWRSPRPPRWHGSSLPVIRSGESGRRYG